MTPCMKRWGRIGPSPHSPVTVPRTQIRSRTSSPCGASGWGKPIDIRLRPGRTTMGKFIFVYQIGVVLGVLLSAAAGGQPPAPPPGSAASDSDVALEKDPSVRAALELPRRTPA